MASSKRKVFWGNNPKYKKRPTNEAFTQNRFQYFSDMEDSSNDEESVIEAANEKVPPIIVDSTHGFTTVYNLIGNQHKFKRMSIGTKIFSDTTTQYEEAIKKLEKNKLQFYTHQKKTPKTLS